MNDKQFVILKSRQVGKSYMNSLSYLYKCAEIAILILKRKEKLRKIFKKDF